MATEELSQQLDEAETDINTRITYLVKECPFIYNARDPKQRDRNLMERTWSTIASQFNLSVEEAKTKWQRLRNNFSKALERRVKTPRSGSAATKLQKPWIYEADMDFLRSHLHYHRASSSSLARQASAADESDPLSPQPDTADVSEQSSENFASTSMSVHCSPPMSAMERDTLSSVSKARKRDTNELDSAVLSFIKKASMGSDKQEDPAFGWFKSILPMYNTLTSIEKLEFQSKCVLELRSLMVAKEQRMTRKPTQLTDTRGHYSTSQDNYSSIPE